MGFFFRKKSMSGSVKLLYVGGSHFFIPVKFPLGKCNYVVTETRQLGTV